MAQNIYDDADFFAGYSGLNRSIRGLEGAPEWPSLRALLPDMHGLRVLDLGCGFGWFCRWAMAQGAAQVVGIDLSDRMLARARALTTDGAIAYVSADLERVDLPQAAFDLAYSSLALHYVEDLSGLLARVRRSLVRGGRLVFSVVHPIFCAPARPDWIEDADGRKSWPVNGYQAEGPRAVDWLGKAVVWRHRTIGTYVNLLVGLGFSIAHLEEWGPTAEQIAADPDLAPERERPMFLLISARR